MKNYRDVLTLPNKLTLFRLICVAPFVVVLLNIRDPSWPWARHLALGIFITMGLTDFLDGLLARLLGQQTNIGRFLDPLADKLLITSAMILLSLERTSVVGFKLPNWVVVAAVGKDLFVVLGFFLIFFDTGKFLIKPSISGKISTAIQMLLIVSVLAAPDLVNLLPRNPRGLVLIFVKSLWFASIISAFIACYSYFKLGLDFIAQQGQGKTEDG